MADCETTARSIGQHVLREFEAFYTAEIARWRPIVAAAGATASD